jgi:metal-sulfur cluster biosynthetic enzyme/nitrite reductase/ring-hydroxylating ferredoxin subunit
MSEFIRVASLNDLADPGRQLVELDDRVVVLIRVGSEIFCLDDVCTHDGGPLSDGPLMGEAIACPRHGAKFDIRTGKPLSMPATKATQAHEVKLEGTEVFVRLQEDGWVPPTATASAPAKAADECCGGTHGHAAPAMNVGSGALPIAAGTCHAQAVTCGPITEDTVREELKKVIDPELFVNIVDLGLIYNVDLLPTESGKLDCKIDMTMTSPMCPAGPQMIANSKQVLGRLEELGNVEVKIGLDPPWTPDKMTEAAKDQLGIF